MADVHYIGLCDYVVITLSFFVSLGIGIRLHFTERKKTSRDFMLAGNSMSRLPVILSIVVTFLSAILMLGAPAEIYRYGSQLMTLILGMTLGIVLASYLLIPIYFKLRVCTVYEYLEMRYGRFTRIAVSGLFILQMMLYMSVVLHAPALALSAVTDLSTEASIIVMGVVCIVYCTLGGLKAVLWTDTFQSGLMYICLLVVFVVGTREAGGFTEIVNKSKEGGRWEFLNFNVDLTTRYTVWNALFRGLSLGIGGYGVSQLEVQRLLSISMIKNAQSALMWSIFPMMVIVFMCYSMGLILYAVFYHCDPVLNGERTGLTKHDQLLPYYIVTRMSHAPGVTGLCIAGLFSGSLSTISSAVNSISTVTVVDFIQPYCSCLNLKDKHIVWIAKALVIFYGLLCIGLTFLLSKVGSLTQMATVALGIMEGPVTAIFLLGVLTVKTNQKGSAIGFVVGCLLCGWIGYGSTLSGYIYPTLPLSAENCPVVNYTTQRKLDLVELKKQAINTNIFPEIDTNITIPSQTSPQINTFFLYRISYMWIPTIGFICTAFVSYTTSVLLSWNKIQKVDRSLLSPIVKRWMDNSAYDDSDGVNLEMRNSTITSSRASKQSVHNSSISVDYLSYYQGKNYENG